MVLAVLKKNGYKMTRQRRAVIRVVTSGSDYLTPGSIYEKVREDHPDVGLVTVYRTLEVLNRLGLICKLHTGNSSCGYTIGASEHHHHLICNKCHQVVAVAHCGIEEIQQGLVEETGFRIDDHLLEFTGLCPACQLE